MEKKVEVQMRDGTMKEFVVCTVGALDKLDLQELLTPVEFDPHKFDKGEMVISGKGWRQYQEKLILLSVKEPVKFRSREALNEIDGNSLTALFKAAQEVNVESAEVVAKIEKK